MILTVGQEYKRTDLHAYFGGQAQGGISTPARHPVILLFTSEAGQQYGYGADCPQLDGTFWYTGEGQVGDMQMKGGNRAIRDSAASGKQLHLFEYTRRAYVRYLGAAHYLGHHQQFAPDRYGNERRVFVFELELEGDPAAPTLPAAELPRITESHLWTRPLHEVRQLALSKSAATAIPAERRTLVRLRSAAVRTYVLRRADGICEACGEPAPFTTKAGRPYLEPHHIHRLADGGPDHPAHVAAICPNCHRLVHHGQDGDRYNRQLATSIAHKERGT